jgi:branched-chain amino acid transport system ATP-binding protein
MEEILLEVKNMETFYDKVKVLNGISFQVKRHQITVILGNNGAGKSTTLNTILGLIDDQPDKGSIYFKGEAIQRMKTTRIVAKGISYVPEGRQVFDELTVQENLMIGAYLSKKKGIVALDMDRMYGYFPVLAERNSQLAGTLSGGEQQMLAIGRALMNNPELLILDEPSLGLSPLLVRNIFEIIKHINHSGITILLVEQNAHMALQLADFGYVMENGRFMLAGTGADLQENEDVQEFYLGVKKIDSIKGYQRYKRKKRWG